MKIGTCVYIDQFEKTPEKLAKLHAMGFTSCQLIGWKPANWTDENANLLKKWLREYEIVPSAFWCGYEGPGEWNFYEGPTTLGLVPPAYREMRVKNLCDGGDFAKLLGLEDIVTHMGFIPEDPNDAEWKPFCDAVRAVAEHLKENGQHLLFETGQETPVAMLRCFEEVGTGNLGVNLDTGNLILYGKANPVDSLDVFGKYVKNIHAKDGHYPTNGHDLGEETRLGDGVTDFRALFTKLRELGYDGAVTIEREIEGAQQDADILYARDYLSQIIEDVYGRKCDA